MIRKILIAIFLGLFVLACAPEDSGRPTPIDTTPIDRTVTTEDIEFAGSDEIMGMQVDYYRNLGRTCGKSGHHTFIVAHRGSAEASPLWIRFHGGGAGWFLEDGTYTNDNINYKITEEKKQLTELLEETGLMHLIMEDDHNFRFMMPSHCDHDLYSGTGAPDVYNPYTPEGEEPVVDGLVAVREALEYTRENYETTHVFAQGTSAGGIGVTSLAISLGEEGRKISGGVVDTGTMSENFVTLAATGCTEFGDLGAQGAFDRIGLYATAEYMPDEMIRKGILDSPLFQIWSRNEHSVCGEEEYTLVDADGQEYTATGEWFGQHHLTEAIEEFNPGGASVSHRMCVDKPADVGKGDVFRECGVHGATKLAAEPLGGDLDRNGEDYNQVVYEWVLDRLNDPVPT